MTKEKKQELEELVSGLETYEAIHDVIPWVDKLVKEKERKVLDKLWGDEELQDAITDYGEWNGTELDKAFNRAKERILGGEDE